MVSRNFPASFWNSNYVHPNPGPTHHQMSELYSADGYSADSWVPAHYGTYAAHAHAYHHNMAQYGSLLRLPQQYGHTSRYSKKTLKLYNPVKHDIAIWHVIWQHQIKWHAKCSVN
jgi:hypothetical protein